MFVCEEAEVSLNGRSISSDEEEEEKDETDEEMIHFVNDATQLTQLSSQGSNNDIFLQFSGSAGRY